MHGKGAILAIGIILSGAMSMPATPAKAGSREAAIVGGIIGAVGTAIIMQQHMNGARPKTKSTKKKSSGSDSASTEQAAKSQKDPFAGAAAPAGYATPVANNK